MMQFTAIVPQTGQVLGEGAGLQTSPDRLGSPDGEPSGPGFLSFLEEIEAGPASEAGAETALSDDTAADTQGTSEQSLALALHVAALFLPPQATSTDPANAVTLSAEGEAGAPADLLALPAQATAPTGAPVLAGAQKASEAPGDLSTAEWTPSAAGTAPAEQGAGLTIEPRQSLSADYDGSEQATFTQPPLTVSGEQLQSEDSGEAPHIHRLPTSAQSGPTIPAEVEGRSTAQTIQAQERSAIEPSASQPAADPVFRLLNDPAGPVQSSVHATGLEGKAVQQEEAPPADATGSVTARGEAQAWHPVLHADQGQTGDSPSGQEFDQQNPNAFVMPGSQPSAAMQEQAFTIPATASAQQVGVPESPVPAPSAAPARAVPIQPEIPVDPTSKSVQFDLPTTDFGQLRVRVVLADQTVHTHMVTDRADLGRLLVDRQDHLGAQLSTAGLDLGQLRVQVDRHGGQHQGYEAAYRQDARFHQPHGQQQSERQGRPARPMREQAGALSVFA